VVDAARLMRVSYRQAKRMWKRYREEGPAGMKHRSAGQPSHRAYDGKLRQKVLRLVREKYSGAVGERFGPTLAAEHLEQEDGVRRYGGGCWQRACGAARESVGDTARDANARSTLES
jgi:Helix-turn-helix domain